MKLRTKFLLSLLAVSAALTCATLVAVQHQFKEEISRVLVGDLHNSVLTYETFEYQRRRNLIRSAKILAGLPTLKAVMTTQHSATIQDASAEFWPMVGSDLFMLTDRDGKVVGLHTSAQGVTREIAQGWQTHSMMYVPGPRWWNGGGHLFEVFSAPIYLGNPSDEHTLGLLTVGYEINDSVATDVSRVTGSHVVFLNADSVVASTIHSTQGHDLSALERLSGNAPVNLRIGDENYLCAVVTLPPEGPVPVRLIVLKSVDQASVFLKNTDKLLVILGLVAVVVGSILVFFISHTFTQPLSELLAGVRALQEQNFDYSFSHQHVGGDEIAELTEKFDNMRHSLRSAQAQLLDAERLATIGRMASFISHDLRHRLTAIVVNAEFLADNALDLSQRQELYSEIGSAVTQMTEMLESLLEFSRTPKNLNLEFVSIREIMFKAVRIVRGHPDSQMVSFRVQCLGDVHGWFDPKRLQRAFFNLLLNSCQVLVPKNGGCVDIDISRVDGRVEIRVTDNGPGVAEAIRPKLFQPFTSFGKQNGSGLGLAIVHKTCQDHGGEVCLETTSPAGSTFKITLPIHVEDQEAGSVSPLTLTQSASST